MSKKMFTLISGVVGALQTAGVADKCGYCGCRYGHYRNLQYLQQRR